MINNHICGNSSEIFCYSYMDMERANQSEEVWSISLLVSFRELAM